MVYSVAYADVSNNTLGMSDGLAYADVSNNTLGMSNGL